MIDHRQNATWNGRENMLLGQSLFSQTAFA
jgi:hypothetical protein